MGIKFHFLEDSEKWQTAYTAENAYYDAGAISSNASFIGSAAFVTTLLFAMIFMFAALPLQLDLFELDPGFVTSLDTCQISEPLRAAFRNTGWVLSDKASCIVLQAGREWEIQDENIVYIIQAREETLNVSGRRSGIMFLLRNLYVKQHLFPLDPGLTETLDASEITEAIRETFRGGGKALGDEAFIIVKHAGSEWEIIDADKRYLIRRERESLETYEERRDLIAAAAAAVLFILVAAAFARAGDIAVRRSTEFFQEFYRPPDPLAPKEVIAYRTGSRIKLPMPFSEWLPSISQFKYLIVENGELRDKGDWVAWMARNLGGPLLLIVFDGSALYVERGNRFSRVIGPGVAFLERHETIKYAVDLRQKVKEARDDPDIISVWTKDGITVKLKTRVEYRIGDPKKTSDKPNLIYPFDPEAVKKAVERYALRWRNTDPEPAELAWEHAVWGQVTGIVPGYIGSRFLDDLLVADRKGGQILSPEATDEIFNRLNKAANEFGVYVTDFQVLSIELPQPVMDHYVKYWEAERQSLATLVDGKAKAFAIRAQEKVRAKAQHDLILAIAGGLKKNDNGRLMEALLLSLSEVLDHGLSDPYMRSYTAKETLETLEKLHNLLKNPP